MTDTLPLHWLAAYARCLSGLMPTERGSGPVWISAILVCASPAVLISETLPFSVLATASRLSSSLIAIRLELLGFFAIAPGPVTGTEAGVWTTSAGAVGAPPAAGAVAACPAAGGAAGTSVAGRAAGGSVAWAGGEVGWKTGATGKVGVGWLQLATKTSVRAAIRMDFRLGSFRFMDRPPQNSLSDLPAADFISKAGAGD